jgi:hypothetical protein
MRRTPHLTELKITTTDNRAVASVVMPGFGAGLTVSRSGPTEEAALAATLRAMADAVDGVRRQRVCTRRDMTWVRTSVIVDVYVPTGEVNRAEVCEEQALGGDMAAAGESLDLALGWLSTALHDPSARNWQAFDWALVDDSPHMDVV